jgi:RNA polymerase sigma-70 factor (ECF subfamily)
MDHEEEKSLVERLTQMDDVAWEEFCGEYSPPLLDFIQYRFGCDRHKAQDIVQMSYVRCVRSIRTFDPARGRLFAWLKTVAGNEARRLIRKEPSPAIGVLEGIYENPAVNRIPEMIDQSPLPDELVERAETRLLVREILLEMNTRQREVLTLKYLDGLRVSGVARRLGCSEKAVESLLSRARRTFKEAFRRRIRSAVSEKSRRIR